MDTHPQFSIRYLFSTRVVFLSKLVFCQPCQSDIIMLFLVLADTQGRHLKHLRPWYQCQRMGIAFSQVVVLCVNPTPLDFRKETAVFRKSDKYETY